MPETPIRKLGEPRIETIVVDLTDAEVVDLDARARQLRDRQDAIKKELAGVKATFKARSQEVTDAEALLRQQASTRKRDVEIPVQDYLTPTNEVISVRTDTHDQIGRRTATATELQGDLLQGDEDDGFGDGAH
jgi:hypothetical protein